MNTNGFLQQMESWKPNLHPLFKPSPQLIQIDLSVNNSSFNRTIYSDHQKFNEFIIDHRKKYNNAFLYGGYCEKRSMYERSSLFGSDGMVRDLHLGIDVWADAGTKIFSPMDGFIHSFNYNSGDGNYGATIIAGYRLKNVDFYLLFGHLSKADLIPLRKGKEFGKGEVIAHIGEPSDNGNWPPHLHLQVIMHIGDADGDYPGVCHSAQAEEWTANSPDPSVLLKN